MTVYRGNPSEMTLRIFASYLRKESKDTDNKKSCESGPKPGKPLLKRIK